MRALFLSLLTLAGCGSGEGGIVPIELCPGVQCVECDEASLCAAVCTRPLALTGEQCSIDLGVGFTNCDVFDNAGVPSCCQTYIHDIESEEIRLGLFACDGPPIEVP